MGWGSHESVFVCLFVDAGAEEVLSREASRPEGHWVVGHEVCMHTSGPHEML